MESNGLVIGIDPSLESAGVCIFKEGSPHHYECIVPYPLKSSVRLQSNYLDYCRIFRTYRNIKCIAFESQVNPMRYQRNSGSIIPLAENIGIMKLAISTTALLYNPTLIVLGIPPGDIKKYATGNSKATKEDMISAVDGRHLKRIRTNIPDYSVNDVADSYHLAKMAEELIQKNEFSKYIYEDYRLEEVVQNESS